MEQTLDMVKLMKLVKDLRAEIAKLKAENKRLRELINLTNDRQNG